MSAHLPLRISVATPSRIDTSADRSVTVSWSRNGPGVGNPYEEAEEFAAFIVRAVNSHEALVKATQDLLTTNDKQARAEARAALSLALAKGDQSDAL